MVAAATFLRCCSTGSGGSYLLSCTPGPLLRHFLPSRMLMDQSIIAADKSYPITLVANKTIPSFSTYCHRCSYTARRRRRTMWECFCTAASSDVPLTADSTATSGVDQSGSAEDELLKIKEAANMLDIRVGKILKVWRHEEADSLYVEQVDVGEPEPRIICSGLVKYVPLDHLQEISVVVLANLKPRNMRGIKSCGMLMAASDASHDNVELLVPPEGSLPGQRIWFGNIDEQGNLPDVASPNQIQKKKIWELVQPHLQTDGSCIARLGIYAMQTSEGAIISRSLKNARIS